MPRGVGLDRERVIAATAALVDAEGVGALTLTRLAEVVGVRPPSLFKHVASLDDLRGAVAMRAHVALADALDACDGDIEALARTWRAWARAHPGVYALAARSHVHAPEPAREAGEGALRAVLKRLEPLVGEAEAVHAGRALRALIHGFVMLEQAGGFGLPESVDLSFEIAVRALVAGLAGNVTHSRR